MSKKSSSSLPKHARDNRANQLNPNNDAYHQSREASGSEDQHSASSSKGEQGSQAQRQSGLTSSDDE